MIVRTNVLSGARRIALGFATFTLVLSSVTAAVPVFLSQKASAIASTQYTQHPFTTSELANWSKDRTTPSGGFASLPSYAGKSNVLELRVNKSASDTSSTFYQTEGLGRPITPSNNVKANLYVDSAWTGNNVRAGLWAVGQNTAGEVSSYPIVEFTTGVAGSFTGWRSWDGVNGGWTNLAAPYNSNAWNALEITYNKVTNKFDLYINDSLATSNTGGDTVNINAVILNSANYAGVGQDYNVHWSDFATGTYKLDTPANLRLANVNGEFACGGATNINNITPTWNAVEGAASYNYKVTVPGGGMYGPTNVGNVTSVTGPFGGEGLSDFSVQAVNAIGGTSEWATPCAVTYDATAPAAPANGRPALANSNNFNFTWNPVTDNGSAITQYQFQSSGSNTQDNSGALVGAWKNWTDYVTPEQKTLTTPMIHSVGAPDGNYYWQVRAIDAAGNVGAWSQIWNMTIDSTAPTATLVFPTPGPTAKSFKVQFNEAVNVDDATNPANYFLENWVGAGGSGGLVGDATVIYDTPSKTATITFINPAWYVSAEQKWGVQGIHDLAGNLLAPSPTTAFSTPVENPTVPGAPETTSPTNKSLVTWTWAGSTDPGGINGSGIKGYEYSLTSASGTSVDWTFTTDLSASMPVAEGVHTLHVYAVDNAGNRSAEVTGQLVVDNTPPAVPQNLAVKAGTVSLSNPGRTNSYGVTVSWDGVPDATKYDYRVWNDIAGSSFTDQASAYTVTQTGTSRYGEFNLGEGTHYIQVRAIDASGNPSAWTDPFVVTYDTTAPVATIATVATNSTQPTVAGTLTGADVDAFTVKLDGAKLNPTRTGNNWSAPVTVPLTYGAHTVLVEGVDLAGNAFSTTQQFTTVAPVVAVVATPTLTVAAPAPLPQNVAALAATPVVTDTTTVPNGEVLGASTTNNDTSAVAGAQTEKDPASTANTNAGGFNAAWYLLLVPAAGSAWWVTAAIRRRNS